MVLRRDGQTWSKGQVPKDGLVVDGIELRVEIEDAGYDGRSEHLSLPTDTALGMDNDELKIDDVRPIATRHALRANGQPLARFLARAFPELDSAALGEKAAALAQSSAAANWVNYKPPFAIEDIAKIGTPVDPNHPERSDLYDAACGERALTVSEPGQATWGYLRKLTAQERDRYRLPATASALLSWTDGSEDNCASDVQLLTAAEAERIATECTGSIIDRILERYRQAGGGDDGHPAHALHVVDARRRRAASEATRREAERTRELQKTNDALFAHVDTGSDTTSEELKTLRNRPRPDARARPRARGDRDHHRRRRETDLHRLRRAPGRSGEARALRRVRGPDRSGRIVASCGRHETPQRPHSGAKPQRGGDDPRIRSRCTTSRGAAPRSGIYRLFLQGTESSAKQPLGRGDEPASRQLSDVRAEGGPAPAGINRGSR